jgi:hypothetical protein
MIFFMSTGWTKCNGFCRTVPVGKIDVSSLSTTVTGTGEFVRRIYSHVERAFVGQETEVELIHTFQGESNEDGFSILPAAKGYIDSVRERASLKRSTSIGPGTTWTVSIYNAVSAVMGQGSNESNLH